MVFVYEQSRYPEGPCIRNTFDSLVMCFISYHTRPLYFLVFRIQKPEPGENPSKIGEKHHGTTSFYHICGRRAIIQLYEPRTSQHG